MSSVTARPWRCDVPGMQRAYATEAQAVAKAEALVREGHKHCVVWLCEPVEVPRAAVTAPVSDNKGRVALGLIRRLKGRQIEETEESA